jgi:hypothetical protein
MIIALAGRRIDAPGEISERFPLRNILAVKESLSSFFKGHGVTKLVSSAACGADLLAQEVASELGLERTIVLPFDQRIFRETSVTDRPGEWGSRYDTLLRNCSLRILSFDHHNPTAYSQANDEILSTARALASANSDSVTAICVWDLAQKPNGDATAEFRRKALSQNVTVVDITTLVD